MKWATLAPIRQLANTLASIRQLAKWQSAARAVGAMVISPAFQRGVSLVAGKRWMWFMDSQV
jgi:hypothetical protein